jgi:hypothetical protein
MKKLLLLVPILFAVMSVRAEINTEISPVGNALTMAKSKFRSEIKFTVAREEAGGVFVVDVKIKKLSDAYGGEDYRVIKTYEIPSNFYIAAPTHEQLVGDAVTNARVKFIGDTRFKVSDSYDSSFVVNVLVRQDSGEWKSVRTYDCNDNECVGVAPQY